MNSSSTIQTNPKNPALVDEFPEVLNSSQNVKKPSKPNPLVELLKPYLGTLIISLILIVSSNGLNLVIPRLIGQYIDRYQSSSGAITTSEYIILGVNVLAVFVLGVLQVWVTVYLSEKIARDLRKSMIDKLSRSSYRFVIGKGVGEMITTFTSDITNVKNVASQGIVYLLTAVILLIGSCVMLIITNWYLALFAISMLPIVILLFTFIFRQISPLFRKSQENIGKINRVVNESIFGSSLVRVLNSAKWEERKFRGVNQTSRNLSLQIVNLFSLLIPSINLVSNIATVVILYIGGGQIAQGQLSLGEFTSFLTYYNLLITPIFILGFTSQGFSRGLVSYSRVQEILAAPSEDVSGSHEAKLLGGFKINNLRYELGGRAILKDISFEIKPGSRNAIVGPTGAGKSQLLSLLIGLNQPTSGTITVDGVPLEDWNRSSILGQIGLVFQDSLVFRGSLRDNIAFSNSVSEESLQKAIVTSSLDSFVKELPDGLDTDVSERGATLSGGQQQRLMLARSLAVNPTVLMLDDFTARVDSQTEEEIKTRLRANYPQQTIISITQKIAGIEDYDQIIVLMEGELVGVGTHSQLLASNTEYQLIYASQQTVSED